MADATFLNAPHISEYFRDLVHQALQKRGSPEGVEFYLVNLLKESISTVALYGQTTEGFREEPLAILYLKASQSGPESRVRLLKRLGDFSLFISGFYPESLNRQAVGVEYYVQMGENAYGYLSGHFSRNTALSEIFTELARRFVAYVDVLSEVSDKALARKDTDLLRLYELWLKTGSRRAAEILASEGIQPILQSLTPLPKLPN